VPREECFVVENAVSGIQAAKAGGMAALGLSRAHDEELLAAVEPDVLVTSLDDVDLDARAEGRLAQSGALSPQITLDEGEQPRTTCGSSPPGRTANWSSTSDGMCSS
jgi:hypothetical protein